MKRKIRCFKDYCILTPKMEDKQTGSGGIVMSETSYTVPIKSIRGVAGVKRKRKGRIIQKGGGMKLHRRQTHKQVGGKRRRRRRFKPALQAGGRRRRGGRRKRVRKAKKKFRNRYQTGGRVMHVFPKRKPQKGGRRHRKICSRK